MCAAGTQSCGNDGTWGSCQDEVTPTTESCNGNDDDCNGTADDGNPGGGGSCNTGLYGICADGTQTCTVGTLQCVQNMQAAPTETCGNGLDDDCNGTADDGCSVACDPLNPSVGCGAGNHCIPQTDGTTVCLPPTGLGSQYSPCTTDADCSGPFGGL